ncbi:GrpB family protein [Candidatus Saccharibacteria bacterium]|nr:GrpB family protein [Candidatus Saccharibacteria bacterium]
MTVKLMHFVSSDSMWELARDAFKEEKELILGLVPTADVQHIGSTVIPGAITKGDLDIQVSVSRKEFNIAVDRLRTRYAVSYPDIWSDTFACFQDHTDPQLPIGVQLTMRGADCDDFYKMRDKFIEDPQLLEQYNSFKRGFEGRAEPDYKQAKREFFGDIGKTKLLNT